MATNGINFSGLASNVQWGDIVETTMKAYEARAVTPISDQVALRDKQRDQWKQLQTLTQALNDSARAVRRTGFSGFTANVPASPTTSRALLTASASASATPGTYRVEVLQLADTAKLGGSSVADTGAALGLSGSFTINGSTISVSATDSLQAIRDTINAANSGGSATGVTATILSDGGTAGRLVLSRDTQGAAAITVTDGAAGLGRELGILETRSKLVSSIAVGAAAALGVPPTPIPASIRVGGRVVTIDLSTESLAAIAAKINAAGGSAAIETVPFGSQTRYRLTADGNVTAVAGDAYSQDVIDKLGLQAGESGVVRQTVETAAYTDSSDVTATSTTNLVGLKLAGSSANLSVGDAINIRGSRGDGTAVTFGFVIESGDTIQTLLDKINDATSGFGAGARTATASIGSDGKIRLADGTGGASRLALSLGIVRADGSSGSLGTSTVSVAGRPRELQVGRDAILRVDGRDVTRSSNAITDAIPGVTMNLQTAEPGTTVDLTVARDLKGAQDTIQKFVDSFNAIRGFFDDQRRVGAPLYGDTMLRTTVDGFTAALRTEVTGNTTYPRLANIGVMLDRNGLLTLNAETFQTALSGKPTEVESLLGFSGVGSAMVSATDAVNAYGTGLISNQIRTIDTAQLRLRQRETDAKARLESRRQQLVSQFTRMEEAMSKAQAQSSLFKNLQGSK
jgi:flagellar hook-associated protein 2